MLIDAKNESEKPALNLNPCFTRSHANIRNGGMSKLLDSSFHPSTSINWPEQLSQNVSWNAITTPSQFVVSTPSSMAGPSSAAKNPVADTSSLPVASTSTKKRSSRNKSRTPDDEETSKQTAARFVYLYSRIHQLLTLAYGTLRFATNLALDQLSALYPNTDTSFEDAVDVVNRLLPYHIFQHPWDDLDAVVRGTIHKGKGKATDSDLADEIEGTKALFTYAHHINYYNRNEIRIGML
jgi:hypothetical protein